MGGSYLRGLVVDTSVAIMLIILLNEARSMTRPVGVVKDRNIYISNIYVHIYVNRKA